MEKLGINELPAHPAINPDFERRSLYGRPKALCAELICPHCGIRRWCTVSVIKQQLKRTTFNGQCRTCGTRRNREGHFQWAKRKGGRRAVNSNGYVVLGPTWVEAEDLPLFRAMQNKNGLFEHRFVMAKHLGRPLRSNECIDHMDGNKTNNAIKNLRIYRRGKQDPGSGNGWGTFYHEWQMAEARIRELSAFP